MRGQIRTMVRISEMIACESARHRARGHMYAMSSRACFAGMTSTARGFLLRGRGSRGSSSIGAGSSARRMRPMIVARRLISAAAARISLRVAIAVWLG
jgi:hypothetical protein